MIFRFSDFDNNFDDFFEGKSKRRDFMRPYDMYVYVAERSVVRSPN